MVKESENYNSTIKVVINNGYMLINNNTIKVYDNNNKLRISMNK